MFREIIYFTSFLVESRNVSRALKMTQLALSVHNSTKLARVGLRRLKEMQSRGESDTFEYSVGKTIVANRMSLADRNESELESMSH
jgi:hypothetical protein